MSRRAEINGVLEGSRRCGAWVLPGRPLVSLACFAMLAVSVYATAQTLDERVQRGRQLLPEGQLEQALVELQQAVDEFPSSAPALCLAGRALGRLRRFGESFEYLVRGSACRAFWSPNWT